MAVADGTGVGKLLLGCAFACLYMQCKQIISSLSAKKKTQAQSAGADTEVRNKINDVQCRCAVLCPRWHFVLVHTVM